MDGNILPAASGSLEAALGMMERALISLKALEKPDAAHFLYDAIETAMDDPEGRPRIGEIWDTVWDLPHLAERSFLLHRQKGVSVEKIAQRLGIAVEEVREYIAFVERVVATPAPS